MEEKFREEFNQNENEVEMNEEVKDMLEKVLERLEKAEESGSQSPEAFKKTIARNIKTYMDLEGLSKDEIAEKADISMQELECIIDGEWNPTINEFFRLLEKLNWKISVLMMLN